jgi:hypothetical protein
MWTFSQALLNSHSSPEPVEASSEVRSSDGAPSAPSSLTSMHGACWSPGKMTAPSSRSRYGMTYAPLTEAHGEDVLTSFLAGFPARTSASPVAVQASTARSPGCGEKWPGSFAKYSPDSSSWRTPQLSLLGGWDEYSETWPRWGSMRNGECWERETPELHIGGTGSGYLLPTPSASSYGSNQGGSSGRVGPVRYSLQSMASKGLWATPTVKGNYNRKGLSKSSGDGLATQVAEVTGGVKIRQTGQSGFCVGSRVIARDESGWPNFVEWWSGIIYYINGDMVDVTHDNTGETYPYPRETVIPLSLPTPTANDAKNTGSASRLRRHTVPLDGEARGPLNPEWVEWLMGWPIGWTDSKPLATARFRRWLRSHGVCSRESKP